MASLEVQTEESGEQPKRGIVWWLVAITAPIGVLGGPIALMDLTAGAVQWGGPLKYLMVFWDEEIGSKFALVYQFIFSSLRLTIPFSETDADYLTVGVLFVTLELRARAIAFPRLRAAAREDVEAPEEADRPFDAPEFAFLPSRIRALRAWQQKLIIAPLGCIIMLLPVVLAGLLLSAMMGNFFGLTLALWSVVGLVLLVLLLFAFLSTVLFVLLSLCWPVFAAGLGLALLWSIFLRGEERRRLLTYTLLTLAPFALFLGAYAANQFAS